MTQPTGFVSVASKTTQRGALPPSFLVNKKRTALNISPALCNAFNAEPSVDNAIHILLNADTKQVVVASIPNGETSYNLRVQKESGIGAVSIVGALEILAEVACSRVNLELLDIKSEVGNQINDLLIGECGAPATVLTIGSYEKYDPNAVVKADSAEDEDEDEVEVEIEDLDEVEALTEDQQAPVNEDQELAQTNA